MIDSTDIVLKWVSSKGWHLFPHQRDMLQSADLPAQLLIAPTGAGKTLAGFLPTLAELANHPHQGLHTIYVSPLKALTADIKRNLMTPIRDMNLDIKVEDRTGDTSSHIKRRQRADPPLILLTTPESLARLISYPEDPLIFAGLQRVLVDEIHALAESKRGDQLALALSRLNGICPTLRRVGLSATVDDPQAITELLSGAADACPVCVADGGPAPDISMLKTDMPPPWSGAGGRYAVEPVLEQIKQHKTTLIFHNTRAQAEIFFHHLWLANSDHLPIAIHHGSLDRVQRQNVKAAMTAGELRAIVCTGSLDLGIDWGDVDSVIQIGAPKNVKRLVQRIGRANHRYNAPSKALIVPANRFEIVECVAALEAVIANDLDGEKRAGKPLDVLCQHIVLVACAGPFDADELYAEVCTTGSYSALTRAEFDQCLDFCTTGGYALRRYDQWHRLIQQPDGKYSLRDMRSAPRIRMNAGTIQDNDTLKVRLQRRRGGKPLGEVEEAFAARHTVKHAIAVTSATTALHLALIALDIKEGDEVIVPAFTWVSTANVVLYQGAKVVFVDIDPTTFNIDPEQLKDKITSKTKAIMVVHLFGLCAPMDEIKSISGDIPLIEDGACAAGSAYKGVPAGGLGLMGCFSFHPRKSITTGEGGMITTNDDALAEKLQILRNHGASISEEQRHHGAQPYILPDFNVLGYNYRMTDLQGALGCVQLKKLDSFIDERFKWANYYEQQLSSIEWIKTPSFKSDFPLIVT